jgi:hypothetical protein
MLTRLTVIIAAFIILTFIAACNSATPTPATVIETVVVKETVEVEKPVEVIVTKEIEKEVEKVVTVEVEKEVEKVVTVEVEKEVEKVVTVEVEKEIRVVQTVEVAVTATPIPEPTADPTNPKVKQVMEEITFVQHTYNRDLNRDVFNCANNGGGLNTVLTTLAAEPAEAPRYVGPNDGDFPLWGANGLFEITPDGAVSFVPQATGGKFVSPTGVEYERFTLQEALHYFASGDVFWTGAHGEPGRIAECDPQFNPDEEEKDQ